MIYTTQSKAVVAYKTINKISGGNLPLPVAFALFKMKKKLAAQFEFQIEQEQKIIEECKASVDAEGNWTFESEEDKKAFVERLTEVSNMPVEIDIDPQTIPLNANIELSVEDMEALENFIEFE